MTLPYQQSNEIDDRYTDTVLFWGEKPVYIYGYAFTPKGLQLSCKLVGEPDKKINIPVEDEKLRDGPFHLGYVNKMPYFVGDDKAYRAIYLTRIPKRQWKQGLCSNNVHFSPSSMQPWDQMLNNPMLRDMLKGRYPSFDKAKGLLKGSLTSAAFARQLAVSKDELGLYKLHYRGKPVAYSETGKKFKLSEDHEYLKELLENYGVAA